MTLTEQPVSTQGPPARPPEDASLSPRWFLGLLLGATALGVAGLVAVVGLSMLLKSDDEGGGGAAAASTLAIELSEFKIDGQLTAPAGDVTLAVTNVGSMAHNLAVRELGAATPDLGADGVAELSLGTLAPGVYEVYCNIAGHLESGMVNTLTISGEGDAAAPAAAGHGDHGGDKTAEEWAAMDTAMIESMLKFPAETEGKGNPILEPTEIKADGTKVFDLAAEIVDWEVEPGKIVEAWTYNGVVPAPQILLDRGDKVEVRVVNNLPLSTDIHWHGVIAPNDQDGVAPYTQDPIPPNGGTFTYEFTANDDAIAMYHAHNHGQLMVVNGMFGTIRIGDNPIPYGSTISGVRIPDEIDLALDLPMVLNDAGTIGLSLNGKSFPATEPVVLQEGDWVSVSYFNEGVQVHPMHLHRFPQLVYAKDGIPLEEPYWVDTLNVAPGERYTVLFRADDVGTWVWHCHILPHVERESGMFGMVTALVVQENPDFDPMDEPIQPSNWRQTAGSPIPVEES